MPLHPPQLPSRKSDFLRTKLELVLWVKSAWPSSRSAMVSPGVAGNNATVAMIAATTASTAISRVRIEPEFASIALPPQIQLEDHRYLVARFYRASPASHLFSQA